jgi:hypothetical protein
MDTLVGAFGYCRFSIDGVKRSPRVHSIWQLQISGQEVALSFLYPIILAWMRRCGRSRDAHPRGKSQYINDIILIQSINNR